MKILIFLLLIPISLQAQDFKGLKSIYCNKLSVVELIKISNFKDLFSQAKQMTEQFKPVLNKMSEAQKKQILEKLKKQDLADKLNDLCDAIDTGCDFDDINSLDVFVSEVEKIQSMAEALVKSSASDAINQTVDCLSINPRDLRLNFNFALALSFADDNKKAIYTFNDLLAKLETSQSQMSKDEYNEFKFYILYNLGVLHSQDSNIDKALSRYQQALEIHPDSKQIKTNIELLFQKQQQQQQKNGQKNQQGKQGDNQDQKNKDKDDENKKNPKNKQYKNKNNNKKQDFKSKKLSKDDVRKILEELKNQENKIRMNEYQKGDKSQRNNDGKNW